MANLAVGGRKSDLDAPLSGTGCNGLGGIAASGFSLEAG
jgi:hypothetical protein